MGECINSWKIKTKQSLHAAVPISCLAQCSWWGLDWSKCVLHSGWLCITSRPAGDVVYWLIVCVHVLPVCNRMFGVDERDDHHFIRYYSMQCWIYYSCKPLLCCQTSQQTLAAFHFQATWWIHAPSSEYGQARRQFQGWIFGCSKIISQLGNQNCKWNMILQFNHN